MTVRGVLQIHSAPPALSPHIEWAVAGIFGVPVKLHWIEQPAAPGSVRTELDWQGRPGVSGEIASALASWELLRFELTEEASPGCDAVRYSCTPALGMFSASLSANGDVMISENRLRAVMTLAASGADADGLGAIRELHGPAIPRSAGRSRPSCRCCSGTRGTPSSSRSGTRRPERRFAGCTRLARLAVLP